ncbi:hypothetical protein RDI58_019941 [Solanum bulbocastanum]|uniref:ATP-dependent DNA helicase n=1 Tax=Solanum bulbocastanum TaxID=147425 RepID=A0AAN8T7Q9_SOLBU
MGGTTVLYSLVEQLTTTSSNLLLKDLMNTNVVLGGKVVVLGGDFRQNSSSCTIWKEGRLYCQSLLYSIWTELEKMQFSENMRAKIDPTFCDYGLEMDKSR